MNFYKNRIDKYTQSQQINNRIGNIWHSQFYHDEFDGYIEKEVIQPNGKSKIDRVYISSYYRPLLSEKIRILKKILFLFLFLFSTFLYFVSGTSTTSKSIYVIFVSIPIAITFPFLLLSLLYLIHFIFQKGDLKNSDYRRCSLNLKSMTLISSITLFLSALMIFINILINKISFFSSDFRCSMLFLVSSALIYIIYFIEKNTKYIKIENKLN